MDVTRNNQEVQTFIDNLWIRLWNDKTNVSSEHYHHLLLLLTMAGRDSLKRPLHRTGENSVLPAKFYILYIIENRKSNGIECEVLGFTLVRSWGQNAQGPVQGCLQILKSRRVQSTCFVAKSLVDLSWHSISLPSVAMKPARVWGGAKSEALQWPWFNTLPSTMTDYSPTSILSQEKTSLCEHWLRAARSPWLFNRLKSKTVTIFGDNGPCCAHIDYTLFKAPLN